MEVRVDLAQIVLTETRDMHTVVLRERNGTRRLSIVIGLTEMVAIQRRIRGDQIARPMSHDLLASVIDLLNGELEKVVINDLRDSTFYAKLLVRQNGEIVEIDSRPSDAIALTAGTDVPVYVEDHVLREAAQ